MRWTGHVEGMKGGRARGRECESDFSCKPIRKEIVRLNRRRWESTIKIYFREIRYVGMDWIHLAEDREQWRALVNTIINFGVL
jgi:hypothetical protein